MNSLHTRAGKLATLQSLSGRVDTLLTNADLDVGEIEKMIQLQMQLVSMYSQHQSSQYDPFLSPTHQPHRGSDVESWLRAKRDAQASSPLEDGGQPGIWYILDDMLDEYRLRADLGIQLGDELTPEHSIEVDPAPAPQISTKPIQPDIDEPVHTHNLEDDCTPDCDGYVPTPAERELRTDDTPPDWNADRGRGDIEP